MFAKENKFQVRRGFHSKYRHRKNKPEKKKNTERLSMKENPEEKKSKKQRDDKKKSYSLRTAKLLIVNMEKDESEKIKGAQVCRETNQSNYMSRCVYLCLYVCS